MSAGTDSSDALQDRGPIVLAITIAFLVASTVFVSLRLVSRIGVVRKVTWDDHFIVLAWLLAFGFSFSICWGTHIGLGRHEENIPVTNQNALRKAEYAFSVLYNPVLMATKTSILMFYLTLSKNQQIFRWAIYATMLVVNAAGFALTLLNVLQCHPVGAVFKDPVPSTAVCTDIVTLYLSSSPVNIITDLAILFLPMPILTGIRLPRKQKIILIITFSFGAFVAVVDVVRIVYLQAAFQIRLYELGRQNATSSRISEQDDFSWYASLSFMWSAIEVHVGIICACVPALKPLVSKLLPSMLHDMNNSHDNSSQLHRPETFSVNGGGTIAAQVPSTATSENEAKSIGPKNEHGNIDMMDFLTTPDMPQPLAETTTMATAASKSPGSASLTFFDFVNMKKPKSMVKMTNHESFFPNALVTILFFLWGFAYGLLSVLNAQFQLVVKLSVGQSLALHAAYYGAYFVGSLTFGRYVLKRWGFKASYIVGLCIYGCGTLIFWPSAVLTSFPAFLISNFIVGLGLSSLEVAANPFIALCGPPQHAETRLNISQGVQAIGSVVSPLLAQKVLFKNFRDAPSLIDVQWAYLGIALFDVALALAFYYLPIPEATDEELEELRETQYDACSKKILTIPVIYLTLAFGVFSQFCYVGGQESVAGVYESYVALVQPNSNIGPFNYQVIGHTVFAVGRFLCAFAGFIIKPRWILLVLLIGLIITSVLAMNLTGYAGVAMIVLILFFESGVFPLIYVISLRGLGRHTKTGSVFLTAAASGGAVFPVIMSPVTSKQGLRYSFCVVVAASAFGTLFPLYVAIVPAARKQTDPVHERRPLSSLRDSSGRKQSWVGRTLTLRRSRKRGISDLPTIEHIEGDKEMT